MLNVLLIALFSMGASSLSESSQRDLASKVDREAAKKQIFEGCMAFSEQVIDVKKKICDCYVANFELKLGDADLALMAKSYTPNSKGKPPTVKMSEVLTYFDYDVATHCTEDSKWLIEIDPEDEPVKKK